MPTSKSRVERSPHRAVYDRDEIHAILDEGIVAHLGFVDGGQPYVIPMMYARVDNLIYLHGAAAGRAIRRIAGGLPICLTVTLIDGVVLARAALDHSMNYRSVVVLGACRPIDGLEQRAGALRAFSEHLIPGRWDEVRPPSKKELKGTSVLAMDLDECSAKRRSGPPEDEEGDYDLPVWAGVIPLQTVAGHPIADPRMSGEYEPSSAVLNWRPTAQRR
jgi:nitroimidazol reductase NimA-like FMN-containing flavoprotein (pyridoxamine 5'-phosphate oxidase superfamily)